MGCQNLQRENRFRPRAKLLGWTIGLLSVGALVAPAVHSQQPAAPNAPRDPLAIYRDAGISPDQESKIKDVVKEFESANAVRIEKIHNLLKEMRALSLEPAPAEAQVLSKQDEINKVQAEISNERIKLLLKIRSILSADQKKKLVDLMQRGSTPEGQ